MGVHETRSARLGAAHVPGKAPSNGVVEGVHGLQHVRVLLSCVHAVVSRAQVTKGAVRYVCQAADIVS